MKKRIVLILAVICVVLSFTAAFTACNKKTVDTATEYVIEATLDVPNATVTCKQQLSYTNTTGDDLTELKFNLYPNAFRKDAKYKPIAESYNEKAFYNGESYGKINITSVAVDKTAVKYDVCGEDKNILSVKIDLKTDKRITLEMQYVVTLPYSHSRFGVTESGVNLCNFFPILCVYENGDFHENVYFPYGDPFYSEVANYNVSITAPVEGELTATGDLKKYEKSGNSATKTYRAENVRDFAAVYLRSGKRLTETAQGVEVNYYYTGDTSPEKGLAAAVNSFSYYQQTFGGYPYKTYNIVDTNFIYGGMEYPCLVLINSDIGGLNKEYTIAHETAHQWWYGLVGNDETAYGWLDEGLTEFSTALYFKHTDRETLFNAIIACAFDEYVKITALLNYDGKMNVPLNLYKTEAEYIVTAYNKGMLLHNTLYNLLGEAKYLFCLKTYLADNKYKNATPETLKAAFTGCAPIIDCWMDGRAVIGYPSNIAAA